MQRVNVVTGGRNAERAVSLRTGAAIAAALEAAGYTVRLLDAPVPIEEIIKCDVVFPAIHGAGGEDGSLQASLEPYHVRYIGSDPAASQLCFNKWTYRQAMAKNNVTIPDGARVSTAEYSKHPLSQRPHVLKPIDSGSSIDTFIVRDIHHPPAGVAEVWQRYDEMLLEELVAGTEITVGVLGDAALPVIEIIPPKNGEFDYENKYNGSTKELYPPLHVSNEAQQSAQALALQIHKLAGCRDLSRTDFIIDEHGTIYTLETNTIPGMTDQSIFPKMAAAAGLTMPELMTKLVTLALTR